MPATKPNAQDLILGLFNCGMTQSEIAELMGFTPGHLCRILSKERNCSESARKHLLSLYTIVADNRLKEMRRLIGQDYGKK